MRRNRLQSLAPGPQFITRRSVTRQACPNRIAGLSIDRPNQVWATDTTEITIQEGKAYLVEFIDLFSRYVTGFALSNTHDRRLCCQGLSDALTLYPAPEYLHSDQGCQYTSSDFQEIVRRHGIIPSMSQKGFKENLVAERLHGTIKNCFVRAREWKSLPELFAALQEWMHHYNNVRPHSACAGRPPASVYGIRPRGQTLWLLENISAGGLESIAHIDGQDRIA